MADAGGTHNHDGEFDEFGELDRMGRSVNSVVESVLDRLATSRRRIASVRSNRSAPGLALLHRLLYAAESVVSSLLDVEGGKRLSGSGRIERSGFIESKYSAGSGLHAGGACDACGEFDDCDTTEEEEGNALEREVAMRAFLDNCREAAVEVDRAVSLLENQSVVERYVSVEENCQLLKAATADLQYSMATFEPLVRSSAVEGKELPRDVVEDWRALMARLDDAAFFADVDVIGSVQDVVMEVVSNFARPESARRGAVEAMVRNVVSGSGEGAIEGEVEMMVEEAVRLVETAEVQREHGVFSVYFLFVLLAGALVDWARAAENGGADGFIGGDEGVGRIEREVQTLRGVLDRVGSVRRVEELERLEPFERSLALFVLAVTAHDSESTVEEAGDRLDVLSASLEFVAGPVTRSMVLLAMGRLLSDAGVRDALEYERVVRYLTTISRWIDSANGSVRRNAAMALAACLGGGASWRSEELKVAAHSLGMGKRLLWQLSRQQDVLGQRATLSALSAMLTDEIAGDLARAGATRGTGIDPFPVVFGILTDHLDQPTIKGSKDVIKQAVRFVHAMVSRSPLARYRAILANGITPLERVLASPSSFGRNFALLSLYHLSRISSLEADTYGWSTVGVEALLDVVSSASTEEPVTPAQSAAVMTLKHVLSRSELNALDAKPVEVDDRHLQVRVDFLRPSLARRLARTSIRSLALRARSLVPAGARQTLVE